PADRDHRAHGVQTGRGGQRLPAEPVPARVDAGQSPAGHLRPAVPAPHRQQLRLRRRRDRVRAHLRLARGLRPGAHGLHGPPGPAHRDHRDADDPLPGDADPPLPAGRRPRLGELVRGAHRAARGRRVRDLLPAPVLPGAAARRRRRRAHRRRLRVPRLPLHRAAQRRPGAADAGALHLREQLERPAVAAGVHHRGGDGHHHLRSDAADRAQRHRAARRDDGRLALGDPAAGHRVPLHPAALHREHRYDRTEMIDSHWYRDGSLHFAVGIEDTFVPQGGPGERPSDEYELTEHYARWHSDLALASEAGAELVRWGVPWYRIQPEPDRWDWDWLDRVMDRFAELGLRPIVDLMHYGTPLWMERQFAHPDYPRLVAEYSARVAERYAHLGVGDYTPVNEPMIHAQFAGEYAYWPPYLSGPAGLSAIVAQIARGFVLAQHAVRDV